MATDVAETEEEIVDPDAPVEEVDETKPTGRFNLGSKKLKIFALLALVMGGEALAIYFVLPQPGNTAITDDPDSGSVDPDEQEPDESIDTVEVSIGTFNITNSRAAAGSAIHVTFNLVAIVSDDSEVAFHKATSEVHKARVRQAIIKVCRSSSLEDLSDPELGVMKRKVREEVNKVLKKSYIIEVVISDFKTMEQ